MCCGGDGVYIFLGIGVMCLFVMNNDFKGIYSGYGVVWIIIYSIYVGVCVDM